MESKPKLTPNYMFVHENPPPGCRDKESTMRAGTLVFAQDGAIALQWQCGCSVYYLMKTQVALIGNIIIEKSLIRLRKAIIQELLQIF